MYTLGSSKVWVNTNTTTQYYVFHSVAYPINVYMNLTPYSLHYNNSCETILASGAVGGSVNNISQIGFWSLGKMNLTGS